MTEEKLEKVIKGLEKLIDTAGCVAVYDADCKTCLYIAVNGCIDQIHKDALELLKAQGAHTETQGRWEHVGPDGIVCCSECGMPMNKTHIYFPDGESGYYYIATKYCPHCGAKNEKGDCDA